ncbi:uncharacterized protein DUF3126 [Humitalea rosea]|uniref:Uncharacterized protein DUF3126 n=1 Tax=Humitalea rosea TaxID=990373 RepID=A0A2W7K153_9PROT|nr:DUF3126 family protein [Humitalea rosea]PZW41330.1 uncharacterized protein DUF3126 [Humitalea rosea]
MTPVERQKVQAYLQKVLGAKNLILTQPPQKSASVELHVNGECLGTVDREAEDGEVSYTVTLVVLAEDLV